MSKTEFLMFAAMTWTIIRGFKRKPRLSGYKFWDLLCAGWLPFLVYAILNHFIN